MEGGKGVMEGTGKRKGVGWGGGAWGRGEEVGSGRAGGQALSLALAGPGWVGGGGGGSEGL